jgi:hypothetical protein
MALKIIFQVDLSQAPVAANMQRQADDAIGATLVEMGLAVQRAVAIETPIGATGVLRGSVFSEPRGLPIREVVVSSTQLYAPIVERGREPGKMPPIGPIALWAKRKLGSNDKSVAFAVARSIAQKGTRALRDPRYGHMFEKGLRAAEPTLARLADGIGQRISIDWKA